MTRIAQLPKSRREWLDLADRAVLAPLTSSVEFHPDPTGRLRAAFITCGPEFYVRRLFERFATAQGYVVASITRHGTVTNPLTGRLDTLFAIALHRRQ